MVVAIIKNKLSRLPTAKYLKIKNKIKAIEIITPRLVCPSNIEKVKSEVKKIIAKNNGTMPKVCGSTK